MVIHKKKVTEIAISCGVLVNPDFLMAFSKRIIETNALLLNEAGVTEDMLTRAEQAYSAHRNPERTVGGNWDEAARLNHRKAIKAALEAALCEQ